MDSVASKQPPSARAIQQSATSVRLGVVLFRNDEEELERLATALTVCAEDPATPEFSVAFLDNSERPVLRAPLASMLPSAQYQHSGQNLGFGAGHNVLMRQAFQGAACQHYVCVNPDAILHPECIGELVAEAGRQRRPGLVEALQFPDEHPKVYDPESHFTPWCSGCVLLVTRQLFAETGGFDENFFMYCEDVDLSWRARGAGFSTAIAPKAIAHHYVGDRPESKRVRLLMLKSGAYLAHKFGHSRAASDWHRQYQDEGGERFTLPEVPPASEAMKEIADFKHLFNMTTARW